MLFNLTFNPTHLVCKYMLVGLHCLYIYLAYYGYSNDKKKPHRVPAFILISAKICKSR